MRSRDSLSGPFTLGAAWLALGTVAALVLYYGLAVWVRAWREHPAVAEAASAAVCAAAVLVVIAFVRSGHDRAAEHPRDDSDDDDDDGGQSRRSPPPVPRGPRGTTADWDRFDRVRADWDRVPAGR